VTKDQEERLVAAWEGIAKGLGDLNETARSAISQQWPDVREPREAVVSRIPTPEEKARAQTGNTTGPIGEWLGEFEPEEEIGPREKEFLAGQAQKSSSPKTAS
jgi:hypothetical protein